MPTNSDIPLVNIVIPLYNEADVYTELINRLKRVIDQVKISTTVILVNDGSSDDTEQLIVETAKSDPRFKGVLLSRNFGHQLALSAGLSQVNASRAAFILDGDLQDPPELLEKFYRYISDGYDVVYAVRKKRKEGLLKRTAYALFYRLMRKISYIDFPLDSGDFSMISRRMVDHLNSMPEQSRFLRGMRSWVGYRQIGVPYERAERFAGDSKYSLKQLIRLAFNGLFNFSETPIKAVMILGTLVTGTSLIYLFVTLIKRFVFDIVPEGFTALLTVIILFGGIQLVAIGVIGEYILRIFFEVKKRPLYIIKEVVNQNHE